MPFPKTRWTIFFCDVPDDRMLSQKLQRDNDFWVARLQPLKTYCWLDWRSSYSVLHCWFPLWLRFGSARAPTNDLDGWKSRNRQWDRARIIENCYSCSFLPFCTISIHIKTIGEATLIRVFRFIVDLSTKEASTPIPQKPKPRFHVGAGGPSSPEASTRWAWSFQFSWYEILNPIQKLYCKQILVWFMIVFRSLDISFLHIHTKKTVHLCIFYNII